MEVFSLFGTIGLKGAEAVKSDLDGVTSKAEGVGNKGTSAFGKFGNAMKNATPASSALLGGLALVGAGIAVLAKKSIDLASDLAEVQNVVDVTFGDMTGSINTWSGNALQKYGLSELAAKKFTGTMGAMLKSSGFAGAELETMSTGLSGLAGDFASFYNLKPEEAFDKIRSGISGETEPLKQLGINLSESNLQAFALAQGLKKPYNKMGEMEKQQVRYKYLMTVSKDAQGDFERTSDSFANQQKLLGETLASVGATIVKDLLPHLANLMKKFNDFFQGDWKAKLEELTPVFVIIGGAILGGIVPALWAMASAAIAAVIPLLPFIAAGALIAAVVYGIVQAVKNWGAITEWFSDIFGKAWQGVKDLTDKVMTAIKTTISNIWTGIKTTISNVVEGIKTTISNVWNGIKTTITNVVNGIKTTITNIWNGIKTVTSNVFGAIKAVIQTYINGWKFIISNVIAGIKALFSGNLGGAVAIVKNIFSNIANGIRDKLNGASAVVKNIINKIKGFFKFSWSLPKLKLPHVKISGSFSLSPPRVPKFGISWYAKGGIMNQPTAFGMNGNNLMVGGEAGAEAIAPISTLRQYVREEMSAVQGNTEALIAELLNVTKQYLPQVANMQMVTDTGALVGAIAPQMDGQLGRIYKARDRGSA